MPLSRISRILAQSPVKSCQCWRGPMTWAAMSMPNSLPRLRAASTQPCPPMPVSTVNLPWPVRSSVETFSPLLENTQACGSRAPGQLVCWQCSSGSLVKAGSACPSVMAASGAVALVHLDAVAIELVDLVGDRLADRRTLLFGGDRVVAAGIHVLLHLHRIDGIEQAERLEDRAEFLDRLVGAGDDLLGDRRALGLIAVEQLRSGRALQHEGQLPGEVEGVLDRGVGAEPVRRRMAVGGVAHAEDAAVRHGRRVHVVDGPGRDRLDGHLEIGIADEIAHDLLGMRLIHLRAPAG